MRKLPNWRRNIVVSAFVLTLAVAAWGIYGLTGTTVRQPPTLDQLAAEGVDPAIIDSLRAARQDVLAEPTSADRWGRLGLIFAAHELDDQAVVCFAEASRIIPQSQRWAYLRARCRASTSPEESLTLLAQCAELPGDPLDTPRLVLVEKLLEANRLDEAEQHLERTLAANPQNARARFAKARLHFLREDYAACKHEIVATHQDVKQAYESNAARAKQLVAEDRVVDAKAVMDAANRQIRSSLCQQRTIGNMLATAMFRLGDLDGGKRQQELARQQSDTSWPDPYTEGIRESKAGLRSMLSESDIAHSQGRYADAAAILEQAISEYPDSLFARIRLGRTQIRLGRIEDDPQIALEHYRIANEQLSAALDIDDSSIEAHFRAGVLALYWFELTGEQQRLTQAEEHFRRAITIKPDFAMAYYNLARCLDKREQPVEAIAAMRESLTLDPNYLPARRALGGLLMKTARIEEAVAELERVLEVDPGDKTARRWLEMMRRDIGSP